MLFRFYSNSWTKESKIFPSLFFGFEKPVLAIPSLAHLLLPSTDTDAVAKSKELNSCPFHYCALRTIYAPLTPFSHGASHRRMAYFNYLSLFCEKIIIKTNYYFYSIVFLRLFSNTITLK